MLVDISISLFSLIYLILKSPRILLLNFLLLFLILIKRILNNNIIARLNSKTEIALKKIRYYRISIILESLLDKDTFLVENA